MNETLDRIARIVFAILAHAGIALIGMFIATRLTTGEWGNFNPALYTFMFLWTLIFMLVGGILRIERD